MVGYPKDIYIYVYISSRWWFFATPLKHMRGTVKMGSISPNIQGEHSKKCLNQTTTYGLHYTPYIGDGRPPTLIGNPYIG